MPGHFIVTLDVATDEPLTIDQLEALGELGGVATGRISDWSVSTTVGAEADSADQAGHDVSTRVVAIAPGTVVALQVLLSDAFDARNGLPGRRTVGQARVR